VTDALAPAASPGPTGPLARLADAAEQARDYAAASKAENTIRAYRRCWADFTAWCGRNGLDALPAEPSTVALYLAQLGGKRKASTIQQRVSAISQAHKTAGHTSPTQDQSVRLVLAGIRRTHGTAQEGKAPVLTADVRKMVDALPGGAIGVRDRALLLLGFAAALRRSELVGLDVGDAQETTDGLVVRITKSKTDQEGAGRLVGVPYGSAPATCPVRALRGWLELRADVDAALFRHVDRHGKQHGRLTDKAVARIVKRAAARVGIDPATVAGHSLRAELATSAAAANVPERVIALQTSHKSMAILRRYIREGSLFRENAAAAVGL
jgi:integrase